MPRRSERRLTKRAVDALEAGDAVYWDRDLAGSGFACTRRGAKPGWSSREDPGGLCA